MSSLGGGVGGWERRRGESDAEYGILGRLSAFGGVVVVVVVLVMRMGMGESRMEGGGENEDKIYCERRGNLQRAVC